LILFVVLLLVEGDGSFISCVTEKVFVEEVVELFETLERAIVMEEDDDGDDDDVVVDEDDGWGDGGGGEETINRSFLRGRCEEMFVEGVCSRNRAEE
jgi:hypothetical protein